MNSKDQVQIPQVCQGTVERREAQNKRRKKKPAMGQLLYTWGKYIMFVVILAQENIFSCS
jgi:hypothetical protein